MEIKFQEKIKKKNWKYYIKTKIKKIKKKVYLKLFLNALIALRPSLPLIGSENVAINAIFSRKTRGSCCAANAQAMIYALQLHTICYGLVCVTQRVNETCRSKWMQNIETCRKVSNYAGQLLEAGCRCTEHAVFILRCSVVGDTTARRSSACIYTHFYK